MLPTVRHFESADNLSVHSAAAAETSTRTLALSFQSLGRQFNLELKPTHLFTATHRTVWAGGGREDDDVPVDFLYEGTVKDEPGSWARISIRNGVLDGMISTASETYFVAPESRLVSDSTNHGTVAYRMSDVDHGSLPGACGVVHSPGVPMAKAAANLSSLDSDAPQAVQFVASSSTAGTVLQQATIGIVADYAYFLAHGANSAADMQSVINQVAGIFQAQLGVNLQVAQTVVYSTSPDPFDNTADPTSLLTQFSAYKGDAASPVYGVDVAHLFTGRSLNGNVLGIAWIGTLCDPMYASGLSEDFSTDQTSLVLLSAHEIGHIFGAYHDNEGGSPCATTPFGFIMNPYISSGLSLQFSGCSLSSITPEVVGSSCLTATMLNPDVTPAPATPTPTAPATATATASPQPTATATATKTSSPTMKPAATRTPTAPRASATPTRTPTRRASATPTSRWRPAATPTVSWWTWKH